MDDAFLFVNDSRHLSSPLMLHAAYGMYTGAKTINAAMTMANLKMRLMLMRSPLSFRFSTDRVKLYCDSGFHSGCHDTSIALLAEISKGENAEKTDSVLDPDPARRYEDGNGI